MGLICGILGEIVKRGFFAEGELTTDFTDAMDAFLWLVLGIFHHEGHEAHEGNRFDVSLRRWARCPRSQDWKLGAWM